MQVKKEINIEIGENIRTQRELAGYTQAKLAKLVGVTPNQLSAIECGTSGASIETLRKLCDVLGISADKLLFKKSEPEDIDIQLAQKISRLEPKYYPQIYEILNSLQELLISKNKDDKE